MDKLGTKKCQLLRFVCCCGLGKYFLIKRDPHQNFLRMQLKLIHFHPYQVSIVYSETKHWPALIFNTVKNIQMTNRYRGSLDPLNTKKAIIVTAIILEFTSSILCRNNPCFHPLKGMWDLSVTGQIWFEVKFFCLGWFSIFCLPGLEVKGNWEPTLFSAGLNQINLK